MITHNAAIHGVFQITSKEALIIPLKVEWNIIIFNVAIKSGEKKWMLEMKECSCKKAPGAHGVSQKTLKEWYGNTLKVA